MADQEIDKEGVVSSENPIDRVTAILENLKTQGIGRDVLEQALLQVFPKQDTSNQPFDSTVPSADIKQRFSELTTQIHEGLMVLPGPSN